MAHILQVGERRNTEEGAVLTVGVPQGGRGISSIHAALVITLCGLGLAGLLGPQLTLVP